MKKTFDRAFRKTANSRRAPLAVLVTTMVVLGIAISTGAAALATDTRHETTSSNDTTSTHTTSTQSTTSTVTALSTTVSVAPITGAGGQAGAVGGGPGGGKGGGGQAAAPVQAAPSESQLAFTGVHVPALILIALGMIAGGIVLRRKLEDVT